MAQRLVAMVEVELGMALRQVKALERALEKVLELERVEEKEPVLVREPGKEKVLAKARSILQPAREKARAMSSGMRMAARSTRKPVRPWLHSRK